MLFENDLINYREDLASFKAKRDKTLAHNEATSVISLKLDDAEPCLNFGWEVLLILGWAFFSTVYGTKENIHLRLDAQLKGSHVNRLIENYLKKDNV
jgi:hypothetical protein